MNPYSNHTFRRAFSNRPLMMGWVLLVFSLLIPRLGFAADSYKVTSTFGAGPYSVNQSVTFHIAAMSATVTDTTYNGSVSIGLYASAGPNALSDSLAVYDTNPPSAPQTGIGVFNFTSGGLDISLTFKTGSPAEQLLIQEIGGTGLFDIYPGPGSIFQASTAFNVTGYLSQYFLKDANGDAAPVSYFSPGGPTDDLTADQASVSGPSQSVTIAYDPATQPTGMTTANTYAVTGVNGSYAGNGGVSIHLVVGMTNNTLSKVYYAVILDYDGSLSDYGNPVTTQDTVFWGSAILSTASLNAVSVIGQYSGSTGLAGKTMNNGKVIVRLWTTSSNTGSDPVSLSYQAPASLVANLSYIRIPFSPSNVQPVKADINPKVYEAGGPASVTMTIQNLSGSPISVLSYKVPANLSGIGDWNLPTFPATLVGHTGSTIIYQAPSGTTDGSFTVSMFSGDAVTVNESITIGMQGTASSIGGGALWGFNLMGVTSTTNLPLITDSSGATVTTYAVPSAPASMTASPANYAGVGDQVSLSWAPVTNEGANGYVVSRAFPPGVGFSAVQTLSGSGNTSWTDSGVTNLSNYNYTVYATNAVTVGAPVTSNSVIPFADPGVPTPVTALTGGSTIQLNWSAPVSVPGSYAVTGYQIWRSGLAGMAPATLVNTVSSTTYNDAAFGPGGVTYFYALYSLDNQYASGAPGSPHISGSSVTVSGFPPGYPPTNVAVSLTSQAPAPATITTSWTAPINNLLPITNYYVFKETDSGGFAAAATVAGLSFADPNVTVGHIYSYYVEAVDSASNASNASATLTGQVGPSAPTGLAATASATAVTLIWNSNASSENVASYVLFSNSSAITTIPAPASGPVTGIDLTPPLQGTNYGYQVEAVNNTGVTGTLSAAVTSAILPLIPSSFAVTVQQTGVSFNVNLNWAAPVSGFNVTSYNAHINDVNSFPGTFLGSFPISPQPVTNSQAVSSAGTTLFYWIRAVDPGGAGPNTMVALQLPPNPPTGLAESPSATAVTVTWAARPASELVNLYSVYRSTNPVSGFVTIGTTAGTSFSDGTGVVGTDYYYKISATNPGGGPGIPGGESLLSAAITASRVPLVPVGLTAALNGASDNVTLTWTSQTSSEANLATYTLSRTINGGTAVTLQTAAASVTSFVDTGITSANAGATILYYLLATNDTGGSSAQEGPVGLQVPPNPPTGLSTTSTVANITVNWTARPASENVSQYTIYRTLLPAGTPTVVGTATPGTAISFTDSTGLSRGATYVYTLTATNPGGGTGVPGGTSLSSTGVNSGLAPLAPTGLTVSGISTSNFVTLGWTPVTGSDPNATAVSLLVNANSAVTTGAVATSISPVTVGGVTDQGFFNGAVTGTSPDTTYTYWLLTQNPFGTSALSVPVSKLTYPGAVSLMPVTLSSDGVSRILNWSWSPSVPADVTQYLIYREISGSGNWVNTHTLNASGLTLPVTLTTAIQPGQNYDYKVVAVNATGNGPDSNLQTFSTLPSAPVSVTAVSGVSNSTVQVNLTWADPLAGPENVTGYTIYRSSSNASTVSYSPIATGIATLNYTDSSVTALGTYYYLITADNSGGLESFKSTANAVAVTTYLAPNPPTTPSAAASNGAVTLSWTAAPQTSYPVSIYVITKTANGVTVAPIMTSAVSILDSSLTNGVTYGYTIQTEDNQGHLSAATSSVSGIPLAGPGLPLNPSAATGDTKLLLTWNPAIPGTLPIGGYQIYTVTVGPVTTYSATVSANLNSYLVTGLSNSVTYTFVMNAIDNSGITTGLHVGSYTVTFSGAPQNSLVNPPSNLAAQAGNAQVQLSWTDSVTVAAPVTGYAVYRSSNGLSGPFSAFVTVAATGAVTQSFNDAPVTNGTTYGYFLQAQANTGAVASNSATVIGIPSAPPTAPATFLEVDGVNQVDLTWSPSPAQNSITISQYVLQQSIDGGGYSPLTILSGSVTSLSDVNAANDGHTVAYEIAAVNSNGTLGPNSSPVTAYPYAAFAPTITANSSSTSAVTLTFSPAGSPSWSVTQYQFVRTTVSSGASTVFAAGPASPVIDSTAALGTLYSYQLEALDSKGHLSAASNAVTDGASNAPAAPATLMVVPGSQQVLIDWPAPVSVTGSLPVSYYLLTINGGAPVSVPVTQTWYLDSGLTDPAAVAVTITVVDDSGQITPNHSVTLGAAPVTTAATDLNPPTGLTATTLGPNKIQLGWKAPNDLGYPVTAFNIYRAASFQANGGTFVTTVASPPSAFGPVTTFTDTGLSANTTYFYVVQAIYAQTPAGAVSNTSPDSNHATATTGAPVAGVPPVTLGTMAFDANVLLPNSGQVLGIYFIAPNDGPTELDIYNIAGNPVRALYATAVANAQVSLTWDGKDRNGKTVASGLYLIEIKGPGIHLVRKVIVVK